MRNPRSRKGLSLVGICALLATGAWTLIASTARAAEFTWSGGALPVSQEWSDPENWVGHSSPAPFSTIASLTFPEARSAQTEDDVSGLTIDHLVYQSREAVSIAGHGLAIGSGGLTLDTPENGYNPLSISSPITLDDDQTWTSISSVGSWGSEPVLEVSGSLSGEQSSLTIDLKSQRALVIGGLGEDVRADDEIGDTTIQGTESIDPHTGLPEKTRVELIKADFNTVDGNPLTVDDVTLQNVAGTGPIVAVDSSVAVIAGGTGPLTLERSVVEPEGIAFVPSAILDAGSSVDVRVEATPEPAVQYNQLRATGSVSLGGSQLDLADHENRQHECPPSSTLPVTTLIAAASITGEFGNAPNGGVITVPCTASTPRTYRYRIDYNTSTSPQTITATPIEEPDRGEGTAVIGPPGTGLTAPTSLVMPTSATVRRIGAEQLEASLHQQLISRVDTPKIRRLIATGYFLMPFTALEAGSLSVYWYDLPDTAKRAARKPKPVLVASGRRTIAAAETTTIDLSLTSVGRKLLTHSKTVKLTARGTFTPAAGGAVNATERFKLKR